MNRNSRQEEELPQVRYFDYKDVETLKRFLNPHGRILSRRQTRLPAKNQRQLAKAVKYARFMGLIPFVAR
jgi:small subunit ribosomal protein S18